jgi:hypothetical protein
LAAATLLLHVGNPSTPACCFYVKIPVVLVPSQQLASIEYASDAAQRAPIGAQIASLHWLGQRWKMLLMESPAGRLHECLAESGSAFAKLAF